MRNSFCLLNRMNLRHLFGCLAGAFLLLAVSSVDVQAASFTPTAANQEQARPGPFCRLGVNLNTRRGSPISDITRYDLAPLGVGWYVSYGTSRTPATPNGMQKTQMIRMGEVQIEGTNTYTYTYAPSAAEIRQVAMRNPGALWFIGNEPDRLHYQDSIRPDLHAAAYHKLYHLLKAADPTAQVYAGSIVQPTEVRMEYLDLVLDAYQARYGELLPVDGWSIHNFILNEASCDHYNDLNICWGADIPPGVNKTDGLRITTDDNDNFALFTEQLLRFRQWMADRGYKGLPVLLSEYGVLMPEPFGFPSSRVNTFMTKTFDYVLNTKDVNLGDPNDDYRLIQRLSWYSVNDDEDYNGYLFHTDTFARSEMGDNYANYAQNNIGADVNFYVSSVTVTPTQSLTQSLVTRLSPPQAITHTVTVQVANSGHLAIANQAVVRVYEGDPKSGAKQIGDDQFVFLAGCGDNETVEVAWLTTVQSAAQTPYATVEWVTLKHFLPAIARP